MALPTRNISSYTLPNRNTGALLQENGDFLLTESGDEILLENPTENPNLSSRNVSSYTLGLRSAVAGGGQAMGLLLTLTYSADPVGYSLRNSSSYSLPVRN